MKTVFAPHLNRNVKFGRRRPVAVGPHFRLRRYLRAELPSAPPTADYSPKALPALTDIYLNDQLGDCVIAGGYHVVGVETGNATGTPFHATDKQLIADYSAIGGYVPGDESTDQGCDEVTALNYWSQHGFANGTKLLGYLSVNPANVAEIQAALYLFENLIICIELPDAWVDPFPSKPGFLWGVVGNPVPENGHSIMAMGYGAQGVTIDTWSMLGTLTYAAIAKYCTPSAGGSLYVVLTPDQLAKGQVRAPNGVAWSQLVADFDQLGGHVPVPAPPAPPAPAPTGVTLTQAQQWASAGLAAAWPK
jgi:hypothetical protein